MSTKEDDVLRFVSALAVFGILPPKPPEQDNQLAVLGVLCIIQAVDRLLSIPFYDPNMETIRKGLREKLRDMQNDNAIPSELFERAGGSMALRAGGWIAAYVNRLIDRAGDEPYRIALEMHKTTEELNDGTA